MRIERMDRVHFFNEVGGVFGEEGDTLKAVRYKTEFWENPIVGWEDGDVIYIYKNMVYNNKRSEVVFI